MSTATAEKLDLEADTAAADAASDARAEVRAGAKSNRTKTIRGKKKPANENKPEWFNFMVNVWITDFNATEFGFFKRARNRAKSRQFTTDMDVFAEVTDDDGTTELLGYREDAWRHSEGMDKRLVFKLFTEKLGWKASMDMMLGRSLQLTLGARGVPVVSFAVNSSDDKYVVYVERSANKWPFLPDHYSFFLSDEKGDPEFYRLRRKFINLGGDYVLYNNKNEKVGLIDGKVFSIGGKWKGKVRAGPDHKRLATVLKLFTGIIFFEREALWHIRSLWKKSVKGTLELKLDRQETELYQNPRRIR